MQAWLCSRLIAIFSTNLSDFHEQYSRGLEAVIIEPLRLLFVDSGLERMFNMFNILKMFLTESSVNAERTTCRDNVTL